MFQMNFIVEVTDSKGNYVPSPLITDIVIEKSIKNLSDKASLRCAIFNLNKHILFLENFDDEGNPENKIYKLYQRGQKIKIHLGYNDDLKLEFVGYIKEVKTDEEGMILECEDELFQFRKKVKNKSFSATSVKEILNYVVNAINPKIKIICDYDMAYEKFTVFKADAIDVLQQLQQDTGADVYFQSYDSSNLGKSTDFTKLYNGTFMDNIIGANGIPPLYTDLYKKSVDKMVTELHFKMPYIEKKNIDSNCDYSMQHNIESSNLAYINTTDRKVKVKIVTTSKNGTTNEVEYGNTGGEEFEFKVNRISNAEMKKRAKLEFDRKMAPGYEGSFTAWLIPYVEPNYSIGIYDEDFPEKDGIYNVESVTTNFNENGAVRTITPGIKLSANK